MHRFLAVSYGGIRADARGPWTNGRNYRVGTRQDRCVASRTRIALFAVRRSSFVVRRSSAYEFRLFPLIPDCLQGFVLNVR